MERKYYASIDTLQSLHISLSDTKPWVWFSYFASNVMLLTGRIIASFIVLIMSVSSLFTGEVMGTLLPTHLLSYVGVQVDNHNNYLSHYTPTPISSGTDNISQQYTTV